MLMRDIIANFLFGVLLILIEKYLDANSKRKDRL